MATKDPFCVGCGRRFEAGRRNQVRCKKDCGRSRKQGHEEVELTQAQVLRAALALFKLGWKIHTPLLPGEGYSLLIWKEQKAYRVRITPAIQVGDSYRYPHTDPEQYDLLVMLLPEGELVYLPELF